MHVQRSKIRFIMHMGGPEIQHEVGFPPLCTFYFYAINKILKESVNDLDLKYDMQIQLYNIHDLIVYNI